MALSGSKAFSISGEGVGAGEVSRASSISGACVSSEENSEAFSISGERVSREDEFPEDRGLPSCSAPDPKSKPARGAVTDTSSLGTKLDVGMWSRLDDHLLEKIFARLPFKSLFQVSSLSRAWRLRVSSDSFQSEVHSSSPAFSGNSYTPLFVNNKRDLVGYESRSRQWHKLPTHSYLQQDVVRDWSLRAGAGSLLCWVCPSADAWDVFHVHVTNPLTRSWKQLPPRADMIFPDIVHIDWDEGSKAYKVVVGKLKQRETLNDTASISVQLFDSKDDSWIMESYKTLTNSSLGWGGSVLINGFLYVLLFTFERNAGYTLISFDVKEKIWNEIPDVGLVVDEDQKPHQLLKIALLYFSEVFVCGSKVMLVVSHMDKVSNIDFDPHDSSNGVAYHEVFSVFRLNLERGLAFEVSRAPKAMLRYKFPRGQIIFGTAAGGDGCIYIGGGFPDSSSVLYNVETREWSSVNSASESLPLSFCATLARPRRWTSVAYQPRLNPFVKV